MNSTIEIKSVIAPSRKRRFEIRKHIPGLGTARWSEGSMGWALECPASLFHTKQAAKAVLDRLKKYQKEVK